MGATYTRQSSSGIVDGGVIEATDLNNEFDPLLYTLLIQRSIIKLNSDSSSKRYHKRALFWLHKAKILSPL